VLQRQGDPEAGLAFASLSGGSPALHAEWGELLRLRLERAGFESQLTLHGLGFELALLASSKERAAAAVKALIGALTSPVAATETLIARVPSAGSATSAVVAPSHVSHCSAELALASRRANAAELEQQREACFAADRSGFAIVGGEHFAAAVTQALEDGPDWPELGPSLPAWPERDFTQVFKGESSNAQLSVALRVADPNRAISAAERLHGPDSPLKPRLTALGAGFEVDGVAATAHPRGACLRIDTHLDASPPPELRRIAFAVQLIEEEASLALAEASADDQLEASALSAADPRMAARTAAYQLLVAKAEGVAQRRFVSVTTPDGALSPPALDAAVQGAENERAALSVAVRVEANQPGFWALVATPCAASTERGDSAGHAALVRAAASTAAPRGVLLEPWIGAGGIGLLGFVERGSRETSQQAAQRLGDALGRALVQAPTAIDVAAARTEMLKAVGGAPRPALAALLEALAPGHVGALAPRGTFGALESASRDAVLARQRELLRLPHRLAVLSPGNESDGALLAARLSRWLKSPEPAQPSPCGAEIEPPSRGELRITRSGADSEANYLAFRVDPQAGPEVALLAELLNLPGGALERALSEPDLVGAARALVLGGSRARALVIQLSAFETREAEASSRLERLLERLSSGTLLTSAEVDSAAARTREAYRRAALDPRFRLVELLEGAAPAPPDAAALRRLVLRLRPDAAIVVRTEPRAAPKSSVKSATPR